MLPLIDLKSQYKRIESDVKSAVISVLDSGQYILGAQVLKLERRLADFAGVDHCVSCASGTDALFMVLLAKGVNSKSIVFTTPFTFIATAEVIALTGATPVFVDVDDSTFNLDPEKLALAIEACQKKDPSIYPIPRAVLEGNLDMAGVIAVDLFGLPADYDRINAIASAKGLFVIEDAAQSFGAKYRGRPAGSLADVGCTSFFPAKPLGAYGDGGAIFCDDGELKNLLESIRVHGQSKQNKYENVRLGVTGRLDEVQAAVLNVKMNIFEEEIDARQRVSDAYGASLRSLSGLKLPHVPDGSSSVWAQYTVLAESEERRTAYLRRLNDANIGSAIYYPIPLHEQQAFRYLGYTVQDFPVSAELSNRAFSLPMHPYLELEDIERVASVLAEAR